MPIRLAWSREALTSPARGLCWRCARLVIRDVRVARSARVTYTCGLNVNAPEVIRCARFLREPGAEDDKPDAGTPVRRRPGRWQVVGVAT